MGGGDTRERYFVPGFAKFLGEKRLLGDPGAIELFYVMCELLLFVIVWNNKGTLDTNII